MHEPHAHSADTGASGESFYRPDLAYIHDAGHGALARDAATRLRAELADRWPHGTVVDVGCGSGILAQAMCESGYDVLGLDVSEAMLALARTRAPHAAFRCESFVTAALPECVAVVAIGEVLSYAFDAANGERERAAWFQRVHAALRPGGVLLFDIATPERIPPAGSQRAWSAGDDWAVLAEACLESPGTLRRAITSFRRVGDLYRRDDEVHRLTLIDAQTTLGTLRALGFQTEIATAYAAMPLPPGLVPFVCRKP